MNDLLAKELLTEILDDGEIVRKRFIPANDPIIDRVGEWEKLREELRFHNRYFPEATIDLARLRELLSLLTLDADELPSKWYRARIQTGDKLFAASEMSAPPKEIASHGRANPAGIPYLYLGSSPVAAVSEVRPHKGEVACIADFVIHRGLQLKVVDLRFPRRIVSPFLLEPGDIGKMRNDLPFLERLGEELTRPVLPQAAAIDYTPSQYLCEFIKKCGYHGVVYRSSVSDGINLALFDPELAHCGAVRQFNVDHVFVEISTRKREE